MLPYPKGFDINKKHFSYCSSIYFVVIYYSDLNNLAIGIRVLSLAKEGILFFLFFSEFFKKKKEGRDTLDNNYSFMCKICKNLLYI
jgi:hypothetical protein